MQKQTIRDVRVRRNIVPQPRKHPNEADKITGFDIQEQQPGTPSVSLNELFRNLEVLSREGRRIKHQTSIQGSPDIQPARKSLPVPAYTRRSRTSASHRPHLQPAEPQECQELSNCWNESPKKQSLVISLVQNQKISDSRYLPQPSHKTLIIKPALRKSRIHSRESASFVPQFHTPYPSTHPNSRSTAFRRQRRMSLQTSITVCDNQANSNAKNPMRNKTPHRHEQSLAFKTLRPATLNKTQQREEQYRNRIKTIQFLKSLKLNL